jgi:hypothetical protein
LIIFFRNFFHLGSEDVCAEQIQILSMALSDNQIDFDPHSEKNTDKGETQKEKKKQKNPSVKTSLRKWKDKKIKIDFVFFFIISSRAKANATIYEESNERK